MFGVQDINASLILKQKGGSFFIKPQTGSKFIIAMSLELKMRTKIGLVPLIRAKILVDNGIYEKLSVQRIA